MPNTTLKNRIRFARGTTAQKNSSTDTLVPGTPFYDTTTKYLYIGKDSTTQIKDYTDADAVKVYQADNALNSLNSIVKYDNQNDVQGYGQFYLDPADNLIKLRNVDVGERPSICRIGGELLESPLSNESGAVVSKNFSNTENGSTFLVAYSYGSSVIEYSIIKTDATNTGSQDIQLLKGSLASGYSINISIGRIGGSSTDVLNLLQLSAEGFTLTLSSTYQTIQGNSFSPSTGTITIHSLRKLIF